MRYAKIVAALLIAGGSASHDGAFADVELEKQVEAARADVTKAMQGVGVTDADIEVSLPVAPLLQAVTAINSAPAAQRTIHAESTGANGKFWQDGPTWCNSFAELGSPNGFRADAVLSNFATSFPNPNTVAVTASVDLDANVDVHWQFMGARYNIRVAGVVVGNACPPGGGVGGHVGASGHTGFGLTGHIALTQDADNFGYQVVLASPPSVNMTISIGFQHIGNLGIPQTFNVPLGVVASGPLPLMVAKQGELVLPGGQKRTYSISLAPNRLNVDQKAATGAWTGKVEIAPAS